MLFSYLRRALRYDGGIGVCRRADGIDRSPQDNDNSNGTAITSTFSEGGSSTHRPTERNTSEGDDAFYWKEQAAALQMTVASLKDQINDQNSTVTKKLHETMEQKEKIQEKRVLQLEMEIARLIEMQSNDTTSIPSYILCVPKEVDYDVLEYANLEIKALEELLTKVLAEKDHLLLKNEQQVSLIKDMANGRSQHGMDDRYYTNAVDNDDDDVIYQLSCRKCNNCKPHIIGKTNQDLRTKVEDHFHQVWKLVDTLKTEDFECIPIDPFSDDRSFLQTEFAMHIAKHCRYAMSAEATVEWCFKNIKIEVLRVRSL